MLLLEVHLLANDFTYSISKVWNSSFPFFRNDLGKLKYVLLCIKESNRLYSVVPQISRVLEKPYEIDGIMVDEGKLLIYFNDVMPFGFFNSNEVN